MAQWSSHVTCPLNWCHLQGLEGISAASDTVQQHWEVSQRPLPLQKLRPWAHICQTKPSSAQNGLGHLLFTFNPIQAQPLDIKTSWNSSHISGFWPILTLTLPASELNHNVCLLVFNWAPSRIISFLQSTGSLMMHYYSWLWHMPTKDKGTFSTEKWDKWYKSKGKSPSRVYKTDAPRQHSQWMCAGYCSNHCEEDTGCSCVYWTTVTCQSPCQALETL